MMFLFKEVMKVKIFVSYHEDPKAQAKATEICKLDVDMFVPKQVRSNKFFESATFLNSHVVDDSVDYVGHVTYSYKSKIAPFDFGDLCKKYNDTHDVIGLFSGVSVAPGAIHPMYDFAEGAHPGFMKIWDRLMDLMGHADYKSLGNPPAFYCNYWIARRDLWNKYCDFANTAVKLLSTDPILMELCSQDSSYRGTIQGTSLTPTRLQEICGKPYYTFEPFVMERLPCFFFHMMKARIKVVSSPTEESWNTYAAHAGASFVIDSKKQRIL